jgi:LysM repeat protein
MKKHRQTPMIANASTQRARLLRSLNFWSALAFLALAQTAAPALAQGHPVTPGQKATAEQVAKAGVPLSELAADAPEEYTVKRGDTLWSISRIFLKSPWRWPELWGMNMAELRNPHLIYPGQHLVLEKLDGQALLRLKPNGGAPPTETVRVSPRVRIEPLSSSVVPTLQAHLIEPFLAEPLIIDEQALLVAPRIVAAPDNRVLITRGDRAYARGLAATPLHQRVPGRSDPYRVFRNAVPITDPHTNALLGFEAQYLGKASLVRSEGIQPFKTTNGSMADTIVPATIDIVSVKEEMRVGDRLLPEPPPQFVSYAPHAPAAPTNGTIVSVYGDAVSIAGQSKVVLIDKGTADGIEAGHVMAILKDGNFVYDKTQPGERADMKLPDERNGLLMVFRPFEHLSYALILEIHDTVTVGDRVTNPR